MASLSLIWQFPIGVYVRNIGKRGTSSTAGNQSSVDPVLTAIPSLKSFDISKIKSWIFTTIRPLSKNFTSAGEFERFYILIFESLSQAIEEKLWSARFPSLAPTFLEKVFWVALMVAADGSGFDPICCHQWPFVAFAGRPAKYGVYNVAKLGVCAADTSKHGTCRVC